MARAQRPRLAPIAAFFIGALAAPAAAGAAQTDLAGPSGSVAFGTSVTVLPNGNIVVVDPSREVFGMAAAGAVDLYNPDLALIGRWTGSNPDDQVGSGGIVVVGGGNYVVLSPHWNNGANASAGAATWIDGTNGTYAFVASNNSLVGSAAGDEVGYAVTVLGNGNYVVQSPYWNSDVGASSYLGAATWGSGTSGVAGAVSATNSLVGTSVNDRVGDVVVALTNGNYVVLSDTFNANIGAATWGDGSSGVVGTISTANSLEGASVGDLVGSGATALSNGNYVVFSPHWSGNFGAVTWGDGATGSSGVVLEGNSLVGSSSSDYVGFGGVTALSNGNYVVQSYDWNNSTGAVTWGDGSSGVTGTVSSENSLVGSSVGDQVGVGVTALANGNYVVLSANWSSSKGAATWGSGTSGVTGAVSAGNSLVGTTNGDLVGFGAAALLGRGDYVVESFAWDGGVGAATLGDGYTGVAGAVSAGNSLVGTTAGDQVGGVVGALDNGNYVVASSAWNGTVGAATWVDGTVGAVGAVSTANSLVGSLAQDKVGSGGITALSGSNYVVVSPIWNGHVGAVTLGNGASGDIGSVSARNSLVGSAPFDEVGSGGVTALGDGNYVVSSPFWSGGAGAVTLASGAFRLAGTIQPWNSVIGTASSGGADMVFDYDAARGRLVVGRPADNIVSVFTMDQVFAANFE